jgi:hypothetical protein
MAKRAEVTSIEALEAFRGRLIIYRDAAQQALDGVRDEIVRTRVWLQTDQREHWGREVRRCERRLEEARQARFSAQLANFRDTDSAQRALRRAQHALEAAREKRRRVNRLEKQYDSLVEPLEKQTEELREILSHDLPRATAYLSRVGKTLDEYMQMAPPAAPQATGGTTGDTP